MRRRENTMATNWRERINKILDAEIAKAREKYREAEGSYRDTGWSRYYNAMEKAEAELDEIESFRRSREILATAESRARRYGRAVTMYRKSMSEYAEMHKGVERPVEETVSVLKHRLDQELYEDGLG